ncbi:hypothetical protein PRIPAC_97277 [Pristionchus pacificus]|uniref:TIL domain-containing protein n=1 Tax=Pristionchus pacificus TaxID=54126 RepID=A0A2A6D0W8_PRIPA|nr:hypothetical protein PRIPAC_97277 [Pristionchus pacificus]|eukprot:PDM83996.1 hypothetical protein PRIPAC_34188 [Pristionchus pacificus]
MVRCSFVLITLSSLLLAGIFALPVEEVDEYRQAKTALSKTCAKNAVWNECSNICPKSCANFDMVNACFSLRCGAPACGCKEGHILRDASDQSKGCVTREVCRELRAKGQL